MATEHQIREMTYQQLRDWWVAQDGESFGKHLPDTLDAIAACLPEGWLLEVGLCGNKGLNGWCAFRNWMCVYAPNTDNEKADRLLLACLAWLAEGGSK